MSVVKTTAVKASCEQYRPLVAKYFPRGQVDTALAVMSAESGCNPVNHNWSDSHASCTGSFGLMQIGCVHGQKVADLEIPEHNIIMASQIWKGSGWQPWGVCTSGKVHCSL